MHDRVAMDTLNVHMDIWTDLHLMALMYVHASDDKYIDHTIRVMRTGTATLLPVPNPITEKLNQSSDLQRKCHVE